MAKELYNLQFKLASGHDPSVFVDIQREMTPEEAKKLNSATGKFIAAPAKEKATEEKEDLYIVVYQGYKNTKLQNIVKYAVMDKYDLEKIEKKASQLEKDKFTIEQATLADIEALLKGESLKGISKARKISLNDINTAIDNNIKRKTMKKKVVDKPVLTKKDIDDEPDTDFAAEDRKEAAKFTTRDDIDRLFNKIVTTYNKYTEPGSPSFKKPIMKEMLQDVFDEYFKKLGEFTKDPYVMAAVLDLIEPKLSKKGGLFNLFVSNFDKTVGTKEMEEMSTTGTGATATPGEGEGMATKYAFAGAGADPKKKKKRIPTMKNEALSTYKMFLKHIFNINN